MHRATLKEVARRAGVHPATASRALNESTRSLVNADTRSKVLLIARELGYSPNPIARSLKTARSESVGLVLPDLTNPIFPPIARGVEDVLREAGYSTWIANTDNDPAREESAVTSFRQRSVEGFILATARLKHPLLDEMTAEALPMVLVNRRAGRTDLSSVTADESAGVAAAVEHLYGLGHREIIHLAGPQDLSTGLLRRQAFQQCLTDLALPSDRVVVCPSYSESAGFDALSQVIKNDAPFTAVVAGNDLIALGCYQALRVHGLKCPRDVSIVGYNDMPFMNHVDPPMTTIRIPQYELGAEAARMLLELVKSPGRHARSMLLSPSLVVRSSTAPPRRRGRTA